NTSEGNDTINESGGGNDTIQIATATSADVLQTLDFAHTGNDLVITYSGNTNSTSQITVTNHYAGAAVEQIVFSNGGTFGGYQLGTGPYLLSTDASTPLDGTGSQDVIASSTAGEALNGGNGNDLLFGNGGDDT